MVRKPFNPAGGLFRTTDLHCEQLENLLPPKGLHRFSFNLLDSALKGDSGRQQVFHMLAQFTDLFQTKQAEIATQKQTASWVQNRSCS